MLTLFHHPFCPHSRFIRLAVAEHGVEHAARGGTAVGAAAGVSGDESGRHDAGAGTDGAPAIPGASVICEFLDETLGGEMDERRLLAQDTNDRIEVRRLLSWFNDKFFEEVRVRW